MTGMTGPAWPVQLGFQIDNLDWSIFLFEVTLLKI